MFTAGDFFRLRYGRLGWVLFMLITMLYSMSWLVSMAIAGGDLMQALAGIPFLQGMTLILVVCVLYTVFGGLYAVIGTDFIQSVIILVGIVFIGGLVALPARFRRGLQHIATTQPSLLNIALPAALLAVFNNMLFGFGEVFHNNVWWSRAFAMRDGVAPRAFILSGVLWFPIPIAAGFIALAAGPMGINIVDENQTGPTVASAVMANSGSRGGGRDPDSRRAVLFDGIVDRLTSRCDFRPPDQRRAGRPPRAAARRAAISPGRYDRHRSRRRRRLVFAAPHWPIIEASLHLRFAGRQPHLAGHCRALLARDQPSVLVLVGIVAGCVLGVVAYFQLGWFTASLVGAGVSMGFTILARFVSPAPFPKPSPTPDPDSMFPPAFLQFLVLLALVWTALGALALVALLIRDWVKGTLVVAG